MAARFMQWGFVILPKTMEMDEQTKKNIYKILEQAKVLEELMKEVKLPLSSTKHLALSMNPHRYPLTNLLKRTPQEHFHQDSWP